MTHSKTFQPIARSFVAATLALIVAASMTRPVLAAGAASTRNIILGAAAVVAGIVISDNVHHKQVAANTIVGYTRDGGTVYADGRIVYPNGTVLYAGNNGTPCSWDGSQQYCGSTPAVYYPNSGYGYQNNGYNYQPTPVYNNNYQYVRTNGRSDADDRYDRDDTRNYHYYNTSDANRYRNGNPQWNGQRTVGQRGNWAWQNNNWNGQGRDH